MTLLDSMLGKNLLLITAVSGSANGTGFYLGIKHALPAGKTFNQLISSKDTTTLRKIDSILYQKIISPVRCSNCYLQIIAGLSSAVSIAINPETWLF